MKGPSAFRFLFFSHSSLLRVAFSPRKENSAQPSVINHPTLSLSLSRVWRPQLLSMSLSSFDLPSCKFAPPRPSFKTSIWYSRREVERPRRMRPRRRVSPRRLHPSFPCRRAPSPKSPKPFLSAGLAKKIGPYHQNRETCTKKATAVKELLSSRLDVNDSLVHFGSLEGAGVVVEGLVWNVLVHEIGQTKLGQNPLGPIAGRIRMSLKKWDALKRKKE